MNLLASRFQKWASTLAATIILVSDPTIGHTSTFLWRCLINLLDPVQAYLPDGVGTVINKAVPLLSLPPLHFGGEVSSRRPCGVLHRLICFWGLLRSRASPLISVILPDDRSSNSDGKGLA